VNCHRNSFEADWHDQSVASCLVRHGTTNYCRICLLQLVVTDDQLHESIRPIQQCFEPGGLLQEQVVRLRGTSRAERNCHRGTGVIELVTLDRAQTRSDLAVITIDDSVLSSP